MQRHRDSYEEDEDPKSLSVSQKFCELYLCELPPSMMDAAVAQHVLHALPILSAAQVCQTSD